MDILQGITIIYCSRCGAPCKLADSVTEDAELLKSATKPETRGYCPDCAVTDYFKHHSMLAQLMGMNPVGKAMLLDPRAQQQFAGIMQAGKADARPEEVNWQRVHDNWELPFEKSKRKRSRR